MSACSLNMTRARLLTEVALQAGKAFLAASTAARISPAVAIGVVASSSCVAGLRTGTPGAVETDFMNLPLIRRGTLGATVVSAATAVEKRRAERRTITRPANILSVAPLVRA
jgi:hypothetical protein